MKPFVLPELIYSLWDRAIVTSVNNSPLFNFTFLVTLLVKVIFFLTMKLEILVSSVFSPENILGSPVSGPAVHSSSSGTYL